MTQVGKNLQKSSRRTTGGGDAAVPKPTAWREAVEIQKRSPLLPLFPFLLTLGTTHAYEDVEKAKIPLPPPTSQHLLEPQLISIPSRGP